MSPAVWPAGTTAPPVITTWSVAADALVAASKSTSSIDGNATIAARTAWGVDIWTLLERGVSRASHPPATAAMRRSPLRQCYGRKAGSHPARVEQRPERPHPLRMAHAHHRDHADAGQQPAARQI